jgi:hypothetical protein
MAGKVVLSTLNDSSGVLATQNGMTGIAKAWVRFTGATGAIIGSFNISSVTRSSAGIYIVNFTTNMADANYSVSSPMSWVQNNNYCNVMPFLSNVSAVTYTAPTTSAFNIGCTNAGGSTGSDPTIVMATVFSS